MRRVIKIWYRAVLRDWTYWRVTYKDGRRTRLLSYAEAKSLKDVFGGVLWIDYSTTKFD
jgi:hypothetical protein